MGTKTKTSKKNGVSESRKIKAFPGNEKRFYKGFPRGKAYALLLKSPSKTLVVGKFLDKIEKLDGVKNRSAAKGIVAKLLGKPDGDGRFNNSITAIV